MNNKTSMMDQLMINSNIQQMSANQLQTQGQQANMSNQGQLPQEVYPPFDSNSNYYQEFWRIYLQNELLISQMKDFVKDVTNLKSTIQQKTEQLHQVQRAIEQNQKSQGKKKNRRIDAEIQKTYSCPYPNCGKNYATEVSMNLHIKLKHKGGNKTEREKYARQLLQATGQERLTLIEELNLPPGYLDQIKQTEIKKSQKQSIQQESNSISSFPADSSHFLEQSADKLGQKPNIN